MPRSLPRPCLQPGCAALVRSRSYCLRHARDRERARGSSTKRGYGSARWQRLRKMVRARDVFCQRAGCSRPLPDDFHCDHIIAKELGGEDALENLQGFCSASCHGVKTRREQRGDVFEFLQPTAQRPGC